MSKALTKMLETYNNCEGMFEGVNGVFKTNISNDFSFTNISEYWIKKTKAI